jgi:hypothetical protein
MGDRLLRHRPGKWSGTLDDGVDHILLVEEVRMDDAVVVVSLGLLAGPGGERMKASFREGALVMQTPGGITLTYRPQPDGTLSAAITRRDRTLRATMTRSADQPSGQSQPPRFRANEERRGEVL